MGSMGINFDKKGVRLVRHTSWSEKEGFEIGDVLYCTKSSNDKDVFILKTYRTDGLKVHRFCLECYFEVIPDEGKLRGLTEELMTVYYNIVNGSNTLFCRDCRYINVSAIEEGSKCNTCKQGNFKYTTMNWKPKEK